MEQYHLFSIFVIIGLSISITEAGVLDPRSINIFDPINYNRPHDRPNQMKKFLSPFRDIGHGLVNTDYDPNNSRTPLGHQINLRTPFDDQNNSRMPVGDPNNLRGMLSYNEWLPDETTQSPQSYLHTDKPTTKSTQHTTSTPDYDQIIAERFPQAAKLLEQLKKLNELKKQKQNQQQQQSHGTWPPDPFDANSKEAKTTNVIQSSKTTKPHPNNKFQDNENATTTATNNMFKGKLGMKKLKKVKFYHQAQPVRPENEKKKSNETVYYIDI